MQTVTLGTALGSVRDIASSVVRESAEQTDRERAWPEAGIRALQAAGLGGLTVSTAHGGQGHGLTGLLQACEILGQECASTAICYGMHCVGASVIDAHATPGQVKDFLAPICEGEHLTTLALSEPATGIHFYFPSTRMQADGRDFVLHGDKGFVTNGGHADSYVISGITVRENAPEDLFSCLILPAESKNMRWQGEWTGMGMHGNSSISLRLDGTRVPQANLLGKEGDQIWYVFNVVAPFFLTAMAGTYLGVAQRALDTAREHLTGRSHGHSGSRLAEHPLLQHRLGSLWARVEMTRQLAYSAASKFDAGADDALLSVLSCKSEAGECAVQVVNEAMTLCGGQGYRDNGLLHRLMRDARASHVMAPTTDILRTWAGRTLLEQPLLTD